MDAPRTLKEKLADLKENKDEPVVKKTTNANNTPNTNRPSSQNSISAISEKLPQLGDNTIEMAAVEKL